MITGADGQPLKNLSVHSGDTIELQAKLYWYWREFDNAPAKWYPQICRYLDFYVYKAQQERNQRETYLE